MNLITRENVQTVAVNGLKWGAIATVSSLVTPILVEVALFAIAGSREVYSEYNRCKNIIQEDGLYYEVTPREDGALVKNEIDDQGKINNFHVYQKVVACATAIDFLFICGKVIDFSSKNISFKVLTDYSWKSCVKLTVGGIVVNLIFQKAISYLTEKYMNNEQRNNKIIENVFLAGVVRIPQVITMGIFKSIGFPAENSLANIFWEGVLRVVTSAQPPKRPTITGIVIDHRPPEVECVHTDPYKTTTDLPLSERDEEIDIDRLPDLVDRPEDSEGDSAEPYDVVDEYGNRFRYAVPTFCSAQVDVSSVPVASDYEESTYGEEPVDLTPGTSGSSEVIPESSRVSE